MASKSKQMSTPVRNVIITLYYVHKWLYPTGDSRYFLSEPVWFF